MKTSVFLLFTLAALLLPALASAQCECCIKRQKGQELFDQGKYEAAIAKWKEGKNSNDVEDCPELQGLIDKANAKIKQRDQAAAQRRREQEAAAQRQRDEEARQRQSQNAELQRLRDKADDDTWDMVKDGDAADCDKYLGKYPESSPGRHTQEALRRKKALTAPAATPPANTSTAPADNMVFVPGGTFQMGDQFGEGSNDEQPVHSVTVSGFYLGKTEVTFDEYDAFCTATGRTKPSDSGWGRGRRPVINVDWYDAVEYCNWLSQQQKLAPVYTINKTVQDPNNQNTSDSKKWKVTVDWNAKGYRLPTEAEWEYAARALGGKGGGKVRFGNGRDILDPSQANFDASAAYKRPYSVAGEYRQQTLPVATFSANSLGLYDMAGNVWEWCWDWYGSDYYSLSDGATNPSGAGSGEYRCVRGGSWYSYPTHCRASYRADRGPYVTYDLIGFRVVRH